MSTTILLYFAIAYSIIANIVFIYIIVNNREEIITEIRELGIFGEWDGTFKGALLTVIYISLCIVLALLLYILSPFILYYVQKEKRDMKKKQEKTNNSSNSGDSPQEEKERPHYRFRMRHDDTIRPNTAQIIYIDNGYNPEINDFFKRNHEKVKHLFKTEYVREYCPDLEDIGFSFIYLPLAISDEHLKELIAYNRPDLRDDESLIKKTKEELAENIRQQFIDGLYGFTWGTVHPAGACRTAEQCAEGITITQGFVHFKETEYNESNNKTEDIYTYFPLVYENDEQFFALILDYIKHTGTRIVFFSRRHLTPPKLEDMDEKVQELTKEIKERMERLRSIGLNNFILNQLLFPQLELSKLQITKDYKLFLVDYNNTEITMPTLSKALFFLYLRHPAGIPFKNLSDYKDELLAIYKKITNRDDIDAMQKSIEILVDPTENSINEKCSRIRSSFMKAFDENVAMHYYITTVETAVIPNKVIALDRDLVIDEAEILK